MSEHPWLDCLLPTAPWPMAEAIDGVGSARLSLNGTWQFNPSPAAGAGWQEIEVPGEWVMQGFDVPDDQPVQYRRSFDLPADWTGLGVRLRFDAVHSRCRCWVNGREVGAYEGPFEVFEFDITPAVVPGPNELVLEIVSNTMSDEMAHGSIYASHPLGGISRKVTLHAVPKTALCALFPSTRRIDGDRWELVLRGASIGAAATWQVTLFNDNEHHVFKFDAEPGPFERSFVIYAPHTWDCEHPNLYRLALATGAAGGSVTYATRIGFREIAVRGHDLLVNGKPVKLRGVNRHEVHPLRGRAGCADLARRDVEIFKAGNVNFIRTSHYPPPEELLDAADELGMFVECECALCWVGDVNRKPWKNRDAKSPEYLDLHLRANAANVAAHRNHPSVILWSLANESAWSDSFAAAQTLVKQLDPTRPTIFHNINEHGQADIMNHHYPELFQHKQPGELLADRNKPLLIGETTHVQVYNRSEVAVDPGVRESWYTCIEQAWENCYAAPHVLGMAIWAGIDDLFVLPDGSRVGYGAWGVIDGWRRRKPEFWHMYKVFSPVRVLKTQLPRPQQGEALRIPVASRFDFTDLSELTITWRSGSIEGRINGPAIPPRGSGELRVTLPDNFRGNELILTFADARGWVINQERIELSSPTLPPADPPAVQIRSTVPVHGRCRVSRDGVTLTVAPETDELMLSCANQVVLAGPPDLMILPLETPRSTDCDNTDQLPLINDRLAGRAVRQVEAIEAVDGSGVRWHVEWEAARGTIDLLLLDGGAFRVDTAWEMKQAIAPRQYGVVFALPEAFDTLAWQRRGRWSLYPEDHIGRLIGEAKAGGVAVTASTPPTHAWRLDDHRLGANDFRATRSGIVFAELRAASGVKLRVDGPGRQAVRAWRDNGGIALLVADYNTGGNDQFSRVFYRDERIELTEGQKLAMTVTCRTGRS